MTSQTAKPFANRDCVSSTPCYRLQGHKSTNWMEVLRHEKYINSMPAVQFKPDKLDSGCCDLQRGTTSLKARTYSRSQCYTAPEHPPGHNSSFWDLTSTQYPSTRRHTTFIFLLRGSSYYRVNGNLGPTLKTLCLINTLIFLLGKTTKSIRLKNL